VHDILRKQRFANRNDDTEHAGILKYMAKVFTIPVAPKVQGPKRRERNSDPRYVDGQKMLVEAMKYLAKADPVSNRGAIELISEHVRTRFRMTDSPLG
jgi:hypothetical protein